MAKEKAQAKDAIQVISENRKASFHYTIEESLEAGLALQGSEVKALRAGTANLADAYGAEVTGELYLVNARIGAYNPASFFGHEPTRRRKILMHRNELDRWISKVRERGYSIVPLMLYFKNGRAKVRLGLAKGKAHEDRRQDIKERETKREMDRAMRRR
jgi:SsrA-binding protein